MEYCIYNAIKTPDGTILHCEHNHDYKTHEDSITGETYMNDGLGYYIRRSVNKISAQDLSVFDNDPYEKIRTIPFWGSYGKSGTEKKQILSLQEMTLEHINAILDTQHHIKKNLIGELFQKELRFREKLNLDESLNKKNKNKKVKI